MSKNLKKMISYYKPYLGVFWADMFFATVSAAVALVIPLVIRYVTSTLIYMEPQAIRTDPLDCAYVILHWWR